MRALVFYLIQIKERYGNERSQLKSLLSLSSLRSSLGSLEKHSRDKKEWQQPDLPSCPGAHQHAPSSQSKTENDA